MRIKSVTVEVEEEEYVHSHHISIPFDVFCDHVFKLRDASQEWSPEKLAAFRKRTGEPDYS